MVYRDTLREDIVGATRAGLQPIWISRDPVEPGTSYTGLQIRNWDEFMNIYNVS